MSCCRVPSGYDDLFSEKEARRNARRYRKKGLDDTARSMVAFLEGRGLEGRTVLEAGGGIGAIQLELLKAGASRTVNVELSSGYEEEAGALLREAGLEGRVERRTGDFVHDDVESADLVVMHRVVCCYPDYNALVGAAAGRAQRALVLSFPRETRLVKLGFAVFNVIQRIRRLDFHVYVHPIAGILAAAERQGLRPVLGHRGRLWQVAGLERAG